MQEKQPSSIKPHVIIIAVIIIVVLAVFLWPSAKQPLPPESAPVPVVLPDPIEPEPVEEPEPEIFEATPTPEAVEIDPSDDIEPLPEPVEVEPDPVDISDVAIETALVTIANSDFITELLVNEGLLQKFVVTITNLAGNEMAPNHRLLNPPEQTFRVYQQANRYWVDPASYKRYTPYVNAMESMDNERLITLFERYEEDMKSMHDEISPSYQTFDTVFLNAIDTLLDTPEVPVPVEVFTDSVVYKFKDEKLERLSAPQKQLLRTGPDNMRRIKAKLREIKRLLENR